MQGVKMNEEKKRQSIAITGLFAVLFILAISAAVAISPTGNSPTEKTEAVVYQYADGYIVSDSPDFEDYIDTSGSDGIREFSELPFWIKVSVILGTLFSLICLLKCAFLIFGKTDTAATAANSDGNRKTIYDAVCENPGVISVEISELTGINIGTARYHLYVLERNRKIFHVKKGGKVYYFRNDPAFTESRIADIIIARSENRRLILKIVRERPGISNKHISDAIGIDKSTVHWHIKCLSDVGAVRVEHDGRDVRIYPIPSVS
ncbi:MAG: winged helix-turn-helix transcriptional regulator [Methanomicrobium sp.]|nr:winged helix-turn-helix transcriptional regulator [Methanomicrobium sp.]MBR6497267.1 winged helix-turn-helix transcriptional regulator [Methanomicrobium sp.]